MAHWIWVALGGILGALARYGLSTWGVRKFPSLLPRATLFINLSGSFLLGILLGSGASEPFYLFAGTGFMGAYTTFSTLNAEIVQLMKKREGRVLALYATSSYVLGIALAFAGDYIGTLVRG